MSDDFCLEHGYEHMKSDPGNPIPYCEHCDMERQMNNGDKMKTEVTFTYKNYRGETSVRLVRPIMVSFGTTGFHPEPQWLLHAWDLNKEAERTFALKDIKDWDAAP